MRPDSGILLYLAYALVNGDTVRELGDKVNYNCLICSVVRIIF